MKTQISIPKEILANIDFANTLNGGRTESMVWVNRGKTGYEVFVKMSGVDPEELQVDVEDGHIWLYTLYPVLKADRQDFESFLPYTLGKLLIPDDVDVEHISAKYRNGRWRVFLPFNDEKSY
ncbi:MAG: Hsp20/alpha crystallin family protein [Siphonobacter sp.]